MKVVLLALFAFFAFANATTRWHQLPGYTFAKYVKEFGKTYSSNEEYVKRQAIFEARLEKIKKHNEDTTKTWKEGVNHLTDRTEKEFSVLLGGKKGLLYASSAKRQAANEEYEKKNIQMKPLPTDIDWRTKGVITAVKDQGNCGSCWSFGTAETIESYWALATGMLTDLSEQQILDCTPNPNDCGGTGGCGGGVPEIAYAQLMATGMATEWTYPYQSWGGQNFKCGTAGSMVRLSNYTVLPSNQLKPVLDHVANVGPLAVNVDASSWGDYESGVFNGCNQVNPDIDHVVQLVGYGTDPQYGQYWLVRNSWTPAWGETGYIRLLINSTPTCGTDLHPQDGTGCNGGPTTVTVCGTCAILYDTSFPVITTE